MSRQTDRDPYRGRDPRQIPAYTLFDAARYLHVPARTIQNWAYGYPYATKTGGRRRTHPLLDAESGYRARRICGSIRRSVKSSGGRFLSGGSALRREHACWNRYKATGFQTTQALFPMREVVDQTGIEPVTS